MRSSLRRLALPAALASLALAGTALAETVKTTPVKGATYTGTVHGQTIKVRVARNGRSAKVSLGAAPGFCPGGTAPEPQSSKPATISHGGVLLDTITYFTGGIHPEKLAKVTIKGHFFKFGSSTPVIDGSVKSVWTLENTSNCSGQESFEAVK